MPLQQPESASAHQPPESVPAPPSVETQPGVLFDPSSQERVTAMSYRDTIQERTAHMRIWDYLSYNENGELLIDGVPLLALIDRYGTPLEVVDTTLIERRTNEWKAMVATVQEQTGYQGEFEYFYAGKANMSAEVALAAYRTGWHAETSGAQDLNNIYWLYRRGLIKQKDFKIICNGFKLPPATYNNRAERPVNQAIPGVTFYDDLTKLDETEEIQYADLITLMRQIGFNITPILDRDELNHFAQESEIPPMDVGLRLKFGKVHSDEDLDQLVSRHGLTWKETQSEAEKIDHVSHLNLTTFHAMVGAAETIDIDTFVNSLLFALDKYFLLRANHPSLTHFNMGGGMAPLSTDYDHRLFLEKLMIGAQQLAEKHQQPLPRIMFEFGSFVAAESGFHAFQVIQEKDNDTAGDEIPWVIIDGGLMAAIPDMLIIDKSDFTVLAVNNANARGRLVRLGDLSCDSDGRFPPKSAGEAAILLPDADEPTYVVICGVGAYQEVLAGMRGSHHCGLLEAPEVIIVTEPDSRKSVYVMPRQTLQESQKALGYEEEAIPNLKMVGLRDQD